jgi:hypothetical protein
MQTPRPTAGGLNAKGQRRPHSFESAERIGACVDAFFVFWFCFVCLTLLERVL